MGISTPAILAGLPHSQAFKLQGKHLPHALAAVAVAESFKVNPPSGLSSAEANERRTQWGANTLQAVRPRRAWRILLDQFASLVIALLAVAAIVALVKGDLLDALAIVVVLVLNALVGFATEWQAGRALDALRRQVLMMARVRRDGHEITVDAADLVPGDIIILNAGDRVPADARIIESASLRAEESALTGESATVGKSPQPVAAGSILAERFSMLYLGTAVASGRATALVTATGTHTELGRIGRLVAQVPDEATPLKRKLDDLGRRLVYLVLIIGALVMLAGWLRGDGLWLMIEVGISLAVAAVPEALPAVTTLVLALGVLRMARQRAIVRRLASVETLGSATIICSDKTGTLTENRMTVREFHLAEGTVAELPAQPSALAGDSLLARAMLVSVLCNEASFNPQAAEGEKSIGDPTETALLAAADAFGFDIPRQRAAYLKVGEHPFNAAAKRMTTLHRAANGEGLAALKGAPVVVLDACTTYAVNATDTRPLDEPTRARLLQANQQMADRALRVLGLAEKQLAANETEIAEGYKFLGWVAMLDPPRPGVADAIRQAREAGIRVVMLTGDQLNTASAIARELHLSSETESHAHHARELENASHEQIAELALRANVFARVSPADKLRIVEALQQSGEIVAVTGDGVNDAPALKRADIGIAMGLRGTEVAKEAADIILADDNFATILRAVEGGRTIYANIIKFVHLMFSKNLGAVLAIFVAIAIGWPLPLLPLQILWLNLVTDVFPALALALEPSVPGVMQRPPRATQAALLSRSFLFLIGWQGAMLAVIILSAYGWALTVYGAGPHAQTIALFAVVGGQVGHIFNCRSRTRPALEGLFSNGFIWGAVAIVVVLQLLAVWWPPLSRVLQTVSPNATDWAVIGLTALAPVVLVEFTKLIARRTAIATEYPQTA